MSELKTEKKIRVGLVEDQILFRKGIKAILSAWKDIEVIFESSDGYSVIQKLNESEQVPDVMLVDISLPPDGPREYSGVDLTTALRATFPKIKILILSVHEEAHFIARLIKSGAHGYLVKDSNPQEVYNAITDVYQKGAHINEKTLEALQDEAAMKAASKNANMINGVQLTRREEEILKLICMQKTTDEIAEELFISPRTVNGHRNNLLQKTNSRNVAGLVAFALSGK